MWRVWWKFVVGLLQALASFARSGGEVKRYEFALSGLVGAMGFRSIFTNTFASMPFLWVIWAVRYVILGGLAV